MRNKAEEKSMTLLKRSWFKGASKRIRKALGKIDRKLRKKLNILPGN
jgi:hypothetical protein